MTALRLLMAIVVFQLMLTLPSVAQVVTWVPPGNRNVVQPEVPYGSIKRTRSGRGTFDKKYQKIFETLRDNQKLIAKIKQSASTYGLDSIHIIGALVGEHTYNVDALDRYQTYYVKALAYLNQDLSFRYKDEPVLTFVQRPEFDNCRNISASYDLWSCREAVWDSSFRGKNIAGQEFPDDRFGRVFFQPFFAGQTFGLGQLNPLTALKVSDIVNRVSQLTLLQADKAPEVYKAIMDPDLSILYMAAVLKNSIDVYKTYAGFDISDNPGITATLYNLGNVKLRALRLAKLNRERAELDEAPKFPEENYYGWLVNNKLAELKTLF